MSLGLMTLATLRAQAPTARAPAPATPVISLAEAQQKVATAPVRYPAHPDASKADDKSKPAAADAPKPDFAMATPPPAPRLETKPPTPGADRVWVPGHYMPEKGAWVWVAGEWGIPATPSSVWIEARYDVKERRWSPGYWQPDRPAPGEGGVPGKDSASDGATYR